MHNLGRMVWEDEAFDWAIEFDSFVARSILEHQHDPIIHYEKQGTPGLLSVNTAEHYFPLLYILGVVGENESVSFFAEKVWGGSLSMRCVRIG